MEIIKTLFIILTFIFSFIALGVNSFVAFLIFKKGKEIDEKLIVYSEKNKFKLAAIDKRLQVAQEAFSLWEEMRSVIHSEFNEKLKVVKKCNDWWFKNCLFLSPKVRTEFFKIIRRIQFYDITMQVARDTKNSEELDKIFVEINDLGSVIEESVDLEKLDYS